MNVSPRVWILLTTALVVAGARAQSPAATIATQPSTPAAPAATPDKPVPFQMAAYVVGLVRPGPNYTTEATPEVLALQAGHMSNIDMLLASGKLAVAGPFVDHAEPNPLAGLFIFRVATIEEARELLVGDPAIAAGRLTVEYIRWLAPSTLRI